MLRLSIKYNTDKKIQNNSLFLNKTIIDKCQKTVDLMFFSNLVAIGVFKDQDKD